MGGRLGNTFVLTDSRRRVLNVLRATANWYERSKTTLLEQLAAPVLLPRVVRANRNPSGQYFVSPSVNGWVGIFDQDSEDSVGVVSDLAVVLSEKLKTVAISFNIWDGDFLEYSLSEDGEVIDEYNSSMEASLIPTTDENREKMRGNPAILAHACRCPQEVEKIGKILLAKLDPFDRLESLGEILAIPNICVSMRDLIDEPTGPIEGRKRFVTAP